MSTYLPQIGTQTLKSLLSRKEGNCASDSHDSQRLEQMLRKLSGIDTGQSHRLASMIKFAQGHIDWEPIWFSDSDSDSDSSSGTESDKHRGKPDAFALQGGLELEQQIHSKLHSFQRDGIAWLWRLHLAQPSGCSCQGWLRAMEAEVRHTRKSPDKDDAPSLPFHVPLPGGAGGILADEMGLGKTVQVASFLGALFRCRRARACIVVAPLSLVDNWEKEIRQWAPGVRVAVYHGSATAARRTLRSIASAGGILITTYGTLTTRLDELTETAGRYLVGPPIGERKEWKRGLVPGHDAFESRWGGGQEGRQGGDGKKRRRRRRKRHSRASDPGSNGDEGVYDGGSTASGDSSTGSNVEKRSGNVGDDSGSAADSSDSDSDSEPSSDPPHRTKGADWTLAGSEPGSASGSTKVRPLAPSSGFDWLVCDEAHAAKNPSTKTAKALRALPARRRLLLTGTPLQNRTDELWSLADLACGGQLLGPRKWFLDRVAGPLERGRDSRATREQRNRGAASARALRAVLAPHMLRREKGPGGMADVRMVGPGAQGLAITAAAAAKGEGENARLDTDVGKLNGDGHGQGQAGGRPSSSSSSSSSSSPSPSRPGHDGSRTSSYAGNALSLTASQPHKKELVLWCRPSSLQLELYRAFLGSDEARRALLPEGTGDESGSGSRRGGQQDALVVLSALLRLCDHPLLLDSRGQAGVAIRRILPSVGVGVGDGGSKGVIARDAAAAGGDAQPMGDHERESLNTRTREGLPCLDSDSDSRSENGVDMPGGGSVRGGDSDGVPVHRRSELQCASEPAGCPHPMLVGASPDTLLREVVDAEEQDRLRGWAGLGTGVVLRSSGNSSSSRSLARLAAASGAGTVSIESDHAGRPHVNGSLMLDVHQVVRASSKMGALLDVLALCRAERRIERRRLRKVALSHRQGTQQEPAFVEGVFRVESSLSGGESKTSCTSESDSRSSPESSDGHGHGHGQGKGKGQVLSSSSRAIQAWEAALGIPPSASASAGPSDSGTGKTKHGPTLGRSRSRSTRKESGEGNGVNESPDADGSAWKEQSRLLVFSRSIRLLDLASAVLRAARCKHSRIDGSVPGRERQSHVDAFNEDRTLEACLLTTGVAAHGLTLTGACRVVLLDPAWNPAVDAQAADRCFRIGQSRDVVVYRLVTCGTAEERQYGAQVFKAGLAGAVLGADPEDQKQEEEAEDGCHDDSASDGDGISNHTGAKVGEVTVGALDLGQPLRLLSRQDLRKVFELSSTDRSETASRIRSVVPKVVAPTPGLRRHIARVETAVAQGTRSTAHEAAGQDSARDTHIVPRSPVPVGIMKQMASPGLSWVASRWSGCISDVTAHDDVINASDASAANGGQTTAQEGAEPASDGGAWASPPTRRDRRTETGGGTGRKTGARGRRMPNTPMLAELEAVEAPSGESSGDGGHSSSDSDRDDGDDDAHHGAKDAGQSEDDSFADSDSEGFAQIQDQGGHDDEWQGGDDAHDDDDTNGTRGAMADLGTHTGGAGGGSHGRRQMPGRAARRDASSRHRVAVDSSDSEQEYRGGIRTTAADAGPVVDLDDPACGADPGGDPTRPEGSQWNAIMVEGVVIDLTSSEEDEGNEDEASDADQSVAEAEDVGCTNDGRWDDGVCGEDLTTQGVGDASGDGNGDTRGCVAEIKAQGVRIIGEGEKQTVGEGARTATCAKQRNMSVEAAVLALGELRGCLLRGHGDAGELRQRALNAVGAVREAAEGVRDLDWVRVTEKPEAAEQPFHDRRDERGRGRVYPVGRLLREHERSELANALEEAWTAIGSPAGGATKEHTEAALEGRACFRVEVLRGVGLQLLGCVAGLRLEATGKLPTGISSTNVTRHGGEGVGGRYRQDPCAAVSASGSGSGSPGKQDGL